MPSDGKLGAKNGFSHLTPFQRPSDSTKPLSFLCTRDKSSRKRPTWAIVQISFKLSINSGVIEP